MKPNRTRLSLEPTLKDKDDIIAHGKLFGTKSIIGSIRIAIARSARFRRLQRRGRLLLERKKDGVMEEVEL